MRLVYSCDEGTNFDIAGIDDGSWIQTTWGGFVTWLIVDYLMWDAWRCEPLTISTVTMTTHLTTLSDNAVLLTLKLTNSDTRTKYADVAIKADTNLAGWEGTPSVALEGRRGFMLYTDRYIFSVIGRQYGLVDDLTTYWFGAVSDDYWTMFYQVEEDSWYEEGADGIFAFSWQSIAVPAGGFTTRSVILKFGAPFANQLELVLHAETHLQSHLQKVPLVFEGSVGGIDENQLISIVMVVDSDPTVLHRLQEGIPPHRDYRCSFVPFDFGIELGTHSFTIYAIDQIGTVSDGRSFVTTIIGPTKSPASSNIASRSPAASVTPPTTATPWPKPTLPLAPPVDLLFVEPWLIENAAFDIYGRPRGSPNEISTAFYCYDVRVLVDQNKSVTEPRRLLWQEAPVINGVRVSLTSTQLSNNAILLTARFTNQKATASKVDICIDCDVFFDTWDTAPVATLSSRRGFVVYSPENALTFLIKDQELVDDVSTYWFGPAHFRYDNFWSQVDVDYITDVDSSLAVSWQDVDVPPSGTVTKRMIVKFGLLANQLYLDFSDHYRVVSYQDVLDLGYRVTSARPDELVSVVVVSDRDGELEFIARDLEVNTDVIFSLSPAEHGVYVGSHNFSIYAIDTIGTISNRERLQLEITGPTISPAATPHPSATSTTAATRTPTEDPGPSPTLPPGQFVDIQIYDCDNGDNFMVWGDTGDPDAGMPVTWWYTGFNSRIRVGQFTRTVSNREPVTVAGVTMSTYINHLSANTILVTYKIRNDDVDEQVAMVATAGDICLDEDDGAPVLFLDAAQGIIIFTDYWDRPAACTIIGGGSPLVDQVDTWWAGYRLEQYDNLWNQAPYTFVDDTDTAFAFSWQGIRIPSGGVVTKSVIVTLGIPWVNTLTLTLTHGPTDQPIDQDEAIPITVSIASVLDESLALILVIDSDPSVVYRVQEGLVSGSLLGFDFYAAALEIVPGPHNLTFYAVDTYGTISQGQSFPLTVVGPTKTASASLYPSPTEPVSATPMATDTRLPAPTVPWAYPLPMTAQCAQYANFELIGHGGGELIRVGYGGFTTRIVIGTQTGEVIGCQPVTVSGVTLETIVFRLGIGSGLIAFRLTNSDTSGKTVHIECDTDILFDTWDDAPVQEWESKAVVIYSDRYALTIFARDTPLVTDLTAYWFGPREQLQSNLWSSSTGEFYGADSALAFSWQDINVPADGSVTKSVVMKFLHPADTNQVTLALDGYPPGSISVLNSYQLSGTTTDSDLEEVLVLALWIDSDVGSIVTLATDLQPNSPFQVPFNPRQLGIKLGQHVFSLILSDGRGSLSNVRTFTSTVTGPSPSRSASIAPTATRSITRSPPATTSISPTPSASPIPTWGPVPTLRIGYECAPFYNFNIFGLVGTILLTKVGVTWSQNGFQTILRIPGSYTQSASNCAPLETEGVTLTTSLNHLGANTLLLTFGLESVNSKTTYVDLGLSADLYFDGNDGAPVRGWDDGRGFTVHSESYGLSFLCKGWPLVDNVSTYWFGNRGQEWWAFWTQTTEPYFFGSDSSLGFSWQGIAVTNQKKVIKSVIIKFGRPDANSLNLILHPPSTRQLAVREPCRLEGSIGSVNGEAAVRLILVADGDPSTVYDVTSAAQLSPNSDFVVTFVPSDLDIVPGEHVFSLYAIDHEGTVSNRQTFSLGIVGPTGTPGMTSPATATRAPDPTAAATASRLPAPTLPSAPFEQITVGLTGSYSSFNIYVGPNIDTAWNGYGSRIRADGVYYDALVHLDQPIEFDGVAYSINFTRLSANAVIFTGTLTNTNPWPMAVDIEVDSDIYFDGMDNANVQAIDQGFLVFSRGRILAVLDRSYPLVDDVQSQWYGAQWLRYDHFWDEGSHDLLYETDSGFAVSWQEIVLYPGESTTRSLIFQSGIPNTNQLDLAAHAASLVVGAAEDVQFSGNVTSTDPAATVSIALVVGSDIQFVASGLEVNTPITFSFSLADVGLSPGTSQFALYAIDEIGTISNGVWVTLQIQGPTKSPTESQSPSPVASTHQATATPMPSPTLPTDFPIPVEYWCSYWGLFELIGQFDGWYIYLAYPDGGFASSIRIASIGDYSSFYECGGWPGSYAGIAVTSDYKPLSDNCGIVFFHFTNENDYNDTIDFEADMALWFDSREYVPILGIDGGRGMAALSDRFTFTVLCRNYPFVTDVSTYWYGARDESAEHIWTQVEKPYYASLEHTSREAFTWQGIQLAPGQTVTKSVIMKFGLPDANYLQLYIDWDEAGLPDDPETPYWLVGTIMSAWEEVTIRLLLVVDGDVANMLTLVEQMEPQFNYSLLPSHFGVSPGSHHFAFYAIDNLGVISNEQAHDVDVIAPTRSPVETPWPTLTEEATASPWATETPLPAPTVPPGIAIPIVAQCAELANFELLGLGDSGIVRIGYNGFSTRLRIGGVPSEGAVGCQAVTLSGVTLSTSLYQLSQNAVLVTFKLRNTAEEERTADVLCDIDVLFDGNDAAPVRLYNGNQAVVIYSERYLFSIVGRSTNLVTDVSSAWYGALDQLAGNYWNDASGLVENVDSAVAFSWQSVLVGPGATVVKRVVMEFGRPNTNSLVLSLSIPSSIGVKDTLQVTGSLASSDLNERISIILILDDDSSSVLQIASNLPANGVIALQFSASHVEPDSHKFAFYAVDSIGTISNEQSTTVVVTGPAKTPSTSIRQSPTRSQTRSAPRSRTRSPPATVSKSPSPTASQSVPPRTPVTPYATVTISPDPSATLDATATPTRSRTKTAPLGDDSAETNKLQVITAGVMVGVVICAILVVVIGIICYRRVRQQRLNKGLDKRILGDDEVEADSQFGKPPDTDDLQYIYARTGKSGL